MPPVPPPRDKASSLHPPPLHNGPLTRARQTPNNRAHPSAAESAMLAEQLKKESEWETLEAVIEVEFKAIRSCGAKAHVVPTHSGETLCLFSNPNLLLFRLGLQLQWIVLENIMCLILCHFCSLFCSGMNA